MLPKAKLSNLVVRWLKMFLPHSVNRRLQFVYLKWGFNDFLQNIQANPLPFTLNLPSQLAFKLQPIRNLYISAVTNMNIFKLCYVPRFLKKMLKVEKKNGKSKIRVIKEEGMN